MSIAAVPEELLNPKEVGQRMKMHVKTVLTMARMGDLPAMKIRGEWRFDWNEVANYLKRTKSVMAVQE